MAQGAVLGAAGIFRGPREHEHMAYKSKANGGRGCAFSFGAAYFTLGLSRCYMIAYVKIVYVLQPSSTNKQNHDMCYH